MAPMFPNLDPTQWMLTPTSVVVSRPPLAAAAAGALNRSARATGAALAAAPRLTPPEDSSARLSGWTGQIARF